MNKYRFRLELFIRLKFRMTVYHDYKSPEPITNPRWIRTKALEEIQRKHRMTYFGSSESKHKQERLERSEQEYKTVAEESLQVIKRNTTTWCINNQRNETSDCHT